jgi:ABC-type transport system involved in multi-copper enzyme maturation permease subunit
MNVTNVLVLAEMRESARSRWLLLCALGFALLSAALTVAGSAGGTAGFGPTAAGLINVELIAIPLFALVAGAMALARDRERGTYGYLRSLPLSPQHIYAAKCVALALNVTGVVFAGFCGAFAAMAWLRLGGDALGLVQFAALTWMLAMACAAIGLLISVVARRSPAALGGAVAAWLAIVVFGDLGIMTTALATHMGLAPLLTLTIINPADAYKIASVAALSGSVDVLGPGGRLASDVFGSALMPVMSAVLVAWCVLSALAGLQMLRRSRDA